MDNSISKPTCKFCGAFMFPDRELFYKGVYTCHRCHHRGDGSRDYDDYQENDADEEE